MFALPLICVFRVSLTVSFTSVTWFGNNVDLMFCVFGITVRCRCDLICLFVACYLYSVFGYCFGE